MIQHVSHMQHGVDAGAVLTGSNVYRGRDMEVRVDLVMTLATALAIAAILWAFLSPSVSRVILKLLCRDDSKFADAIFTLLGDKRNRPRLKELVDTMYADHHREFDELQMQVATNTDRLEGVSASVIAHGAEMKEVRALVKDVPNIGPSLDKLSRTLETMGQQMVDMNLGMARIDEWRKFEEKRRGEVQDNGQRRREEDR